MSNNGRKNDFVAPKVAVSCIWLYSYVDLFGCRYVDIYIYIYVVYICMYECTSHLCMYICTVHYRRRAQRLCNTFGIKNKANEKPGSHLPFGHPSQERLRTYVKTAASKSRCHPQLVCNFDQVWCKIFRPQRKCLQKSSSLKGIPADPAARSICMRQVSHNLERSLDLPLTEPDPKAGHRRDKPREPELQGGSQHWNGAGSAPATHVDELILDRRQARQRVHHR